MIKDALPGRTKRSRRARGGLVLAMSLACGCSFLRAAPDTSKYFALSSTADSSVAVSDTKRPDVHFGLGPISLPGYLDAQAVVRAGAGGSVEYIPHAFWAEPLSDGFARALLYRTETRIGTPHGVAFPWYSTTRVDWKIPVNVLKFEATADGRAILVARWSVERASDGAIVAGAQSSFEESAGSDPALIVDALSRCVDRLADAIAQGVTSQAGVAPPATRTLTKPAPKR
jgi:uncharacterized lipoprotein YmbA